MSIETAKLLGSVESKKTEARIKSSKLTVTSFGDGEPLGELDLEAI